MAELSPSACRLDATGRREQADRYRRLSESVTAVERRDHALDVSFAAAVDVRLLREAVDVERACCPFFDLRLDDHARTLHVAVAGAHDRPALDALADAIRGEEIRMAEPTSIRETVRERYAAAATAGGQDGCCGGGAAGCGPADEAEVFGASLYDEAEREDVPAGAVGASLGCGVPTAVADLSEGETVLDLGSGAGADVLISARRVGATGRAIGLDMTDEMLALARANAEQAGVPNAEFLKGYLEDMPLPDAAVDVVISNCVINLSADKGRVIREAARVLRPGGRFAVSDVIADSDMDEETRADMAAWTGCIAGALTEADFTSVLRDAGFEDIEIRETHRVHEHAAAAIIRARKPSARA